MKLNAKDPRVATIAAVVLVVMAGGGIWYFETHKKSDIPATSFADAAATSTSAATSTAAPKPHAAAPATGSNAPSAPVPPSTEAGAVTGPVIDARSLSINTNGWVTCKNTAYGYEVRYPAAWMAFTFGNDHWNQIASPGCANAQTITFSANDPLVEKITIAVYPEPGAGGIPGVALNSTAAEPGMSWQETTIGGESALWNSVIDVAANQRTDSVNIRHNGKLYVITYWFCTATTYVNLNEIYFQAMAENLRFI